MVPGFSQKHLEYFQKKILIEIKIKLKSYILTSALFLSLFDLDKAIEKKTSTQTFHKISYNTFVLARRAIKLLDFITLRTKITVLVIIYMFIIYWTKLVETI